jgi:hypothetical protein
LLKEGRLLGKGNGMSHKVAGYAAIMRVFEYLLSRSPGHVVIHGDSTLTNCEIVEIAVKIQFVRHAEPIRYHPMVQRHLCVSTLDNSFVERRTCSPRRITFMRQAHMSLPGPTRSGPPCRSRFRAGKYSNAKLHPWRGKGQAPDISRERGQSWRQGKEGFIPRVWG